MLGALLLVAADLRALYGATIVAEALGVAALLVIVLRGGGARGLVPSAFSWPLLRELVRFGLPMMLGYEMAAIVLNLGDRYVVHALLGAEPLGVYAAAYNLCQYVNGIVIASLGQAAMPIAMKIWSERGQAATRDFIDRAFAGYVMVAPAIVAGMAAVGPDLLPMLASSKYAAGAAILPWVMAGMALDGAGVLLGAGLFVERRTFTIMQLVLGSAALNIVLNLLLLPHLGIVGAALATLVTYVALAVAMAVKGARCLPVRVPWGGLLRAGLASALMYGVVSCVHAGGRPATIAARVVVGGLVYGALMLAVEPRARGWLRAAWRRA